MPPLPSDEESWYKQTGFERLETTDTIHSFDSPDSGSKITLRQFLLLRILWVKKTAPALSSEYSQWEISKSQIDVARNHLRKVVGWEQYKSTFINDLAWHQQEGFLSLGTFSLVRLYQLNSRSIETRDEFIPKLEFSPRKTRSQAKASDGIPVTPTRSKKTAGNVSSPFSDAEPDLDRLTIDDDDDEDEDDDDGKRPHNVLYMSPLSPPSSDLAHTLKSISDEQIINMALLLYLQALLINIRGIGADWTPERRALIVKKKDGQKVYEARVDGFLRYQSDKSNPIMAIVEVKPCIRDINPNSEPSECKRALRWLRGFASTPHHPLSWLQDGHSRESFEKIKEMDQLTIYNSRLLVSQDRENIYLTFAKFNSSYVHYICDSILSPKLSASSVRNLRLSLSF